LAEVDRMLAIAERHGFRLAAPLLDGNGVLLGAAARG